MKRILLFLLAAYCLPSTAYCQPDCLPLYPVEIFKIVDVDTVKGSPLFPWGAKLDPIRIRAMGFDGWESNKRRFRDATTDEEIRKGKLATAALTRLLARGTPLHPTGAPRWHLRPLASPGGPLVRRHRRRSAQGRQILLA